MQEKVLFILGAGASFNGGFPLAKSVLNEEGEIKIKGLIDDLPEVLTKWEIGITHIRREFSERLNELSVRDHLET